MTINKENTVLLVVDMQEKILAAMSNKEQLIENSERLIKAINVLQLPIISTVQNKKGLGATLPIISDILNSNNQHKEFEKFEFSCASNENILNALAELDKKNVIIIGIESHVCVQQTVLDLLDDGGFKPIVIADCISSRKEYDKKFALKAMRDFGAYITTYESIIFELLKTAKSPLFKEISKIVK